MLRTIILSAFVLLAFVKHSHAGIDESAQPTFVDSACTAGVSNTAAKKLATDNGRFKSPTFFDLKVQIQKELSKFFSTRISAINISTGATCDNPLSDSTCTVVTYQNPDGTPITVDGIYQFVVYSSLYNYIYGAKLDSGQLETVRAEFMKGYLTFSEALSNKTYEEMLKDKLSTQLLSALPSVNAYRVGIVVDAMMRYVSDANNQAFAPGAIAVLQPLQFFLEKALYDLRKSAVNSVLVSAIELNRTLVEAKLKEIEDEIKREIANNKLGLDNRNFNVIMKEVITSLEMTSGLNNKPISDVLALIDSASTKIAEKMIADGLFLQKLGHSSLVAFPITSRLIECLDGTFRNLFMKDVSLKMHRTPFGVAQDYFKPAVILALILYFIAYGYKIVMANGMGKQSEIIMFAIKFGLVFYFSIGEAWKDFAFDMLKSIPATVSQIVFEALPGSADGCSAFKPSMYPQGKGMLSFFDTIDCKYANYIGLSTSQSIPTLFSVIAFPILVPIPILGLLVTALGLLYLEIISFGILAAIEVYISSILFLTFYLFLAPLVVPMALFSKTEDICKKYQTKIMGTVVQAVMAVVMMSMSFALMDGIIYGNAPTSPEHNLFPTTPQPYVNGVPQPRQINKDCYGGRMSYGLDRDMSQDNYPAQIKGVVPMACMLAKIESPGWWSFPIPEVLEIFRLPIPSSFWEVYTHMIIPCGYSVMLLFVVKTLTGQLTAIIDKISLATNTGAFGAAKYEVMNGFGGDAMKKAFGDIPGATAAVDKIKETFSGKGGDKGGGDKGGGAGGAGGAGGGAGGAGGGT